MKIPSYLVMLICVTMLMLFTGMVRAVDYPESWPRSLDEVETSFTPNRMTTAWVQANGSIYCGSGTLTQVASVATNLMRPLSNESFLSEAYLRRNQDRVVARDLNADDATACAPLVLKLKGSWIVDQFRSNDTRPVYALTDNFPSVKNKIGSVAHSTPCGTKVSTYSAKIKAYEWRRVVLPDGNAGATVCRKQS